MRINIHDKFKSWRHFVNVVKRLYRFLDKNEVECKSLVIYATLNRKGTDEFTTLSFIDKDGKAVDEVGVDVGYFEWENVNYDGMLMKYVGEKKLLSQPDYKSERTYYKNQREKENIFEDFKNNYFPICCSTKAGKKKRQFNNTDEIKTYGYSWKRVKEAIDKNKPYRDYIWERGET